MQRHPKELSIDDFTYDLPDHRIARFPLVKRDHSKLLIYKNGQINADIYTHLDEQLPKDTLLIFNNTKVVEARLLFTKESGSTIELFCLEPGDNYEDITTAMLQKEKVLWKCLVGGAKKWKQGLLEKIIELPDGHLTLTANKIDRHSDHFLIEFTWDKTQLSFAEVLHLAGQIPLPPYLNREVAQEDKETYQTVYAKYDGSVAAPTAGLHFTDNLLERMQQKGIQEAFVTLHVGAGTFKPVKAATMQDHEMHAEFIEVPVTFIEKLLAHVKAGKGKIVAVGTTSLRTLETLYWIGVKIHHHKENPSLLEVHQWDPYQLPQKLPLELALTELINYLEQHQMDCLLTRTHILIAPGYQLRVIDGIITNFHQPKSTLLLLVGAIVGDDWRQIYQYALDHDFRFLSYGDGSLLWKQ